MQPTSTEPEKKILEAAKKVFEFSGFNGARMQQIADEAGISKASLHYYFRSKENLFERIFEETMDEFMKILSMWGTNDDDSWETKLKRFIIEFFKFLETHSLLFILREINRNPELLKKKSKSKPKAGLISYFENLKTKGVIGDININLVYIYLHSLCSYPILNKSIFKRTTGMNEADFSSFMDAYPQHVADLLINLIKTSKHK